MAKKDQFEIEIEWIGGPHDGETIRADADDDFVEIEITLPGEGSKMRIQVPVEFRENGKPIIVWRPEFSRYTF